jgi:hypothetical protein
MSSIWVPGPIAWIVLRAAGLVPTPVCHRLEEEWLADLLALDGPVQKIRFALGCVWAALQMRRERITGTLTQAAHRNFIEERPVVQRHFELWIPFPRKRNRTRAEAFTWLARLHRGLRADDGLQLRAWLKSRSHRKCIARAAAAGNSPEHLAVLDTHVLLLILSESLVLCVVGAAIGLFVGSKLLLFARIQIAAVTVPHGSYGIGLAYAATLALAAGALAAWRGAKLRVVDGRAKR